MTSFVIAVDIGGTAGIVVAVAFVPAAAASIVVVVGLYDYDNSAGSVDDIRESSSTVECSIGKSVDGLLISSCSGTSSACYLFSQISSRSELHPSLASL